MLLEIDNFLLELSKLFQQQRTKISGSLSITMKRYDGHTKPKPQLTKKQRLEKKNSLVLPTATTTGESIEYKCLVRAIYGSKKLSTIVSSKDMNRFQLAYSNLLKANMDSLKKKAKESKVITTSGQTSTANSNNPSSPVSAQPKKTSTTPNKKK